MQNKRGFTLVEVIVALGILAVVFSGTVTLIINIINLQLSARDRNEAVAKAQGIMSEKIALIACGCSTDLTKITEGADFDTETRFPYSVEVTENYDYNSSLSVEDSVHFAKIRVVVSWESKGLGEMQFPIEQIVRLEQ